MMRSAVVQGGAHIRKVGPLVKALGVGPNQHCSERFLVAGLAFFRRQGPGEP